MIPSGFRRISRTQGGRKFVRARKKVDHERVCGKRGGLPWVPITANESKTPGCCDSESTLPVLRPPPWERGQFQVRERIECPSLSRPGRRLRENAVRARRGREYTSGCTLLSTFFRGIIAWKEGVKPEILSPASSTILLRKSGTAGPSTRFLRKNFKPGFSRISYIRPRGPFMRACAKLRYLPQRKPRCARSVQPRRAPFPCVYPR